MLRILDKLNTPAAVIAVLVVIVAVNGFLLVYQQSDDAPQPSVSSETGSRAPDEASGGQPRNDTEETANPEQTTREQAKAPEDTTEKTEPEREDQAPQNTDQTQETAGKDQPSGNAPEDATQDEEQQNTDQQNEDQQNGNQQSGDQQSGDQQSEDQQSEDQRSEDQQNGDQQSAEHQKSDAALLAGLTETVRDCGGDREECVRDFVARAAPESRYVGGRTDLQAGAQNTEVLYFEDPDLGTCEFERGTYDAENGSDLMVIVVGEGSFGSERDECIPTA